MTTTALDRNELPHDQPAPGLLGLAERGWVPDTILRAGIRRLCAQRLRDELAGGVEAQSQRQRERLAQLRHSPLAIETDAANRQHYELPPAFFSHCLGPRLKYSSCYYPNGDETLEQAVQEKLSIEHGTTRKGPADARRPPPARIGAGAAPQTLTM